MKGRMNPGMHSVTFTDAPNIQPAVFFPTASLNVAVHRAAFEAINFAPWFRTTCT